MKSQLKSWIIESLDRIGIVWVRLFLIKVYWFFRLCVFHFTSNDTKGLPISSLEFDISEKVFVIGSGSSILNLSQSNFDEINASFSIGMNSTIFHDFVADSYFIESPRDEVMRDLYLNVLKYKFLNMGDASPPICYDADRNNIELFSSASLKFLNLHYYLTLPYLTNRVMHAVSLIAEYGNMQRNFDDALVGPGATLERVMSLLLKRGAREVVIVGVDLNTAPHFWQVSDLYLASLGEAKKFEMIPRGLHRTADPSIKKITTLELIQHYGELFKNNGASLTFHGEGSALINALEEFKFQGDVSEERS